MPTVRSKSFKEKDFQTLFTRWMREYGKNIGTVACELKITKLPSIAFTRLEEHQLVALLHAKRDCVYHKISDQSMGYKPFDNFQICGGQAYVVVFFVRGAAAREMVFIDVEDWEKERATCGRKSITEARAKEIGKVYQL